VDKLLAGIGQFSQAKLTLSLTFYA